MIINNTAIEIIRKEREDEKRTMDCLNEICITLYSCCLHKKLQRTNTNTWIIYLKDNDVLTNGRVELVNGEYVNCVLFKKNGDIVTFINDEKHSIQSTVKKFVASLEKDLL